jgi:gas vesicle protein
VTERGVVCAGTIVGAIVGAVGSYLFFTERGHELRDRMEPAVDELMQEFGRFRRTFEKVGDMATDGLRAFNEFQQARGSQFPGPRSTSH